MPSGQGPEHRHLYSPAVADSSTPVRDHSRLQDEQRKLLRSIPNSSPRSCVCSIAHCVWVLMAFATGASLATFLVYSKFQTQLKCHPHMTTSVASSPYDRSSDYAIDLVALQQRSQACEHLNENLGKILKDTKDYCAASLKDMDALQQRSQACEHLNENFGKNLQDTKDDCAASLKDSKGGFHRLKSTLTELKEQYELSNATLKSRITALEEQLARSNATFKSQISELKYHFHQSRSALKRHGEALEGELDKEKHSLTVAEHQGKVSLRTAMTNLNKTSQLKIHELQALQQKLDAAVSQAQLADGLQRQLIAMRAGGPEGELSAKEESQLMSSKQAFITMAHDASGRSDHLWKVMTLARTLQRVSDHPLIVLTDAKLMPDGTTLVEDGFRRLNARVMPLVQIDMPANFHSDLYPSWKIAYWKLQIWNMTEFEKLVWLDVDSLVLRSLDWLFDETWMWAQRDDWMCKQNQPLVCSGLVLAFPNAADFQGMQQHVSTKTDWQGGDQELISSYFAEAKQMPIQLLPDNEASFGQCLGQAKPTYVNSDSSWVAGEWSTPAFIHKSGGWGNHNDEFSNVCFNYWVPRQYYERAGVLINACHFHPLGPYWRTLFCEGARIAGVQSPESTTYCDDGCWFRGKRASPQPHVPGMPQVDDASWCRPIQTLPDGKAHIDIFGQPAGKPMEDGLPATTTELRSL
eukprot:CAMPEP_0183486838 /NCGR_PEP_ID=MMETSP0370-20130417/180136_1 /TAXON_ID=268820 /ORGANISM="Peridinium aciculiferum, Strain PAER-2" /LENGTH=692 /DNA_ID=CAMNT_0025680157 /DNA_START=122 /DNA_END=2200 /DNA_ORIENTATION=+